MLKKVVIIAVLCWLISSLGISVCGQDQDAPFTKAEILRLLKPAPGSRSSQGDLAGEITRRGIAFAADEKTLGELRKAGARSFLIEAIAQAAARENEKPAAPVPASVPQPTEPAAPAAPAPLTLLEQARHHALEFMEDLPNFIVIQIVNRYERRPGQKDWEQADKLEIELRYRAKQGEQFTLLRINDRPTERSYQDLGGATSTGEFGSMLAALFSPASQADFRESRRDVIRGHQAVVYDFKVKKANSSSQITDRSSGRTVTAGYEGSVWIDTETGRVLRIEQSAVDMQRNFPITLAESAVEYDWITIAEQRFLLPVYAEVILGSDADRHYSRNVIELRNYRMFDTDVKIVP